jgi:hypothetical protein
MEIRMNRIISTLLVVAAMGAGAQAFADDTSSSTASGTTMNTHQMMKDCMAKAKAANNGMSEEDMKKSCKDQIKAKVDHPDDSSPTVTPAH